MNAMMFYLARMEASFIEDRSISKPSCSPIELRSSEAAVANDKKIADKCDHFTIRGYVADVRKKDATICWPFPTLHNYSQSENTKLLPPLSMTKFKRWDCHTCWGTTIASASAIENGEIVNTTNYERKNDNFLLLHDTPMTSYQNATTFFSGLEQPYEKNALEGRSNNTNSSINVCNTENHSSLCCGNTESESHLASHLTKEGLQIYRDEHKISDQNQKQPNSSNYIAVEGDKFGTEEKGEGNTDLSAKAYATSSLCGDAPVSDKENKVKSICVVTGSQMCGNPTSKSTNVASFGIEANQLMSGTGKIVKLSDIHSGGSGMHVTAHMTNHDSVGLEDHHEEPQNDFVTLSKITRNQKKDNQLEKLSGKTKHKKVRKVRLLNDIMRNDKLHLLGEAEPNENIDEKMEGRSKEETRNPEHGRWFVGQKTVVNHTERRNTSDVIPNDEGQHFLTQCLKKIPNKRAITLDGYVETQTCDCPIGISQLDTNTSSGKDIGHKIEVPKVRCGKREAIVGRKKNVLPHLKAVQSHLFPQQDSFTVKGKASKDLPNDRMQKKYVQRDLKILDNTHQKDISCIKKRKAHHVNEEQFYQMQFPKDKVTKKRRTTWTWDKGAVDDIPMDIVELLANNLHEKRLKNAEYATKRLDYLPQVTENLKDGGVTGVVKHHGNEGSEAVDDKLIQQNSPIVTSRNGLWAAGTNVENAYDLQKAYRSSTICDQNRDIYPNQQKVGDSSTKFHAFSDSNIFPISKEDICVTGQYENSFPQNFCHDRSNLMGQVISYRSSGKSHDASQVLLSGETSGINGTNSKLNKLNTDNINIHLNTDQRNYVHKTSLQRSLNPTAKHPLAHKWKDGPSFSGGIPTAATSVLEVDNECHSMATWPADQHTSENIFTSNFSAMWSGGCFPALPNTNCTRLIDESELLRAGVGFKSETVEHKGNSCKLVRPIPRIGILGNILQNEITNLSGNFRPQSVIKVGCFDQIMSPNISSRTAYSKWIAPNVVSTSHPECSRTSNVIGGVELRNEDGWVQSPSSSFGMEICDVNRNPADFTSPDEQSMYMRGKECVRPECIPTSKSQKCQANGEKLKQKKVKKLSALKLLMRG